MNLLLEKCAARHPAARERAPAALRGLDLSVSHGEQLAIIGPSGAGKTTLLHLLACALRPDSGSLQLGGRNPWTLSRSQLQQLRGELFLAPQIPPLPPRQRAVTAVLAGRLPHETLWASVRSLFYPTDIAMAERALARFDLSDKLFERVDRLSGGERQRVGLARALASKATLFLVDEPLSALDPSRGQQAMESLTGSARERGATLVTTMHHVEMALQHFPRIIGLRDGELAFDLPSAQVTSQRLHALYEQHLHELTASEPPTAQEIALASEPVAMHCR